MVRRDARRNSATPEPAPAGQPARPPAWLLLNASSSLSLPRLRDFQAASPTPARADHGFHRSRIPKEPSRSALAPSPRKRSALVNNHPQRYPAHEIQLRRYSKPDSRRWFRYGPSGPHRPAIRFPPDDTEAASPPAQREVENDPRQKINPYGCRSKVEHPQAEIVAYVFAHARPRLQEVQMDQESFERYVLDLLFAAPQVPFTGGESGGNINP